MEITVPHKFRPSNYHLPLIRSYHDGDFSRAVCVWHRQAGKDKTLLNITVKKMLEHVGTYNYVITEFKQGSATLSEGDAAQSAWLGLFRPGSTPLRPLAGADTASLSVLGDYTLTRSGSYNLVLTVGGTTSGHTFSFTAEGPVTFDLTVTGSYANGTTSIATLDLDQDSTALAYVYQQWDGGNNLVLSLGDTVAVGATASGGLLDGLAWQRFGWDSLLAELSDQESLALENKVWTSFTLTQTGSDAFTLEQDGTRILEGNGVHTLDGGPPGTSGTETYSYAGTATYSLTHQGSGTYALHQSGQFAGNSYALSSYSYQGSGQHTLLYSEAAVQSLAGTGVRGSTESVTRELDGDWAGGSYSRSDGRQNTHLETYAFTGTATSQYSETSSGSYLRGEQGGYGGGSFALGAVWQEQQASGTYTLQEEVTRQLTGTGTRTALYSGSGAGDSALGGATQVDGGSYAWSGRETYTFQSDSTANYSISATASSSDYRAGTQGGGLTSLASYAYLLSSQSSYTLQAQESTALMSGTGLVTTSGQGQSLGTTTSGYGGTGALVTTAYSSVDSYAFNGTATGSLTASGTDSATLYQAGSYAGGSYALSSYVLDSGGEHSLTFTSQQSLLLTGSGTFVETTDVAGHYQNRVWTLTDIQKHVNGLETYDYAEAGDGTSHSLLTSNSSSISESSRSLLENSSGVEYSDVSSGTMVADEAYSFNYIETGNTSWTLNSKGQFANGSSALDSFTYHEQGNYDFLSVETTHATFEQDGVNIRMEGFADSRTAYASVATTTGHSEGVDDGNTRTEGLGNYDLYERGSLVSGSYNLSSYVYDEGANSLTTSTNSTSASSEQEVHALHTTVIDFVTTEGNRTTLRSQLQQSYSERAAVEDSLLTENYHLHEEGTFSGFTWNLSCYTWADSSHETYTAEEIASSTESLTATETVTDDNGTFSNAEFSSSHESTTLNEKGLSCFAYYEAGTFNGEAFNLSSVTDYSLEHSNSTFQLNHVETLSVDVSSPSFTKTVDGTHVNDELLIASDSYTLHKYGTATDSQYAYHSVSYSGWNKEDLTKADDSTSTIHVNHNGIITDEYATFTLNEERNAHETYSYTGGQQPPQNRGTVTHLLIDAMGAEEGWTYTSAVYDATHFNTYDRHMRTTRTVTEPNSSSYAEIEYDESGQSQDQTHMDGPFAQGEWALSSYAVDESGSSAGVWQETGHSTVTFGGNGSGEVGGESGGSSGVVSVSTYTNDIDSSVTFTRSDRGSFVQGELHISDYDYTSETTSKQYRYELGISFPPGLPPIPWYVEDNNFDHKVVHKWGSGVIDRDWGSYSIVGVTKRYHFHLLKPWQYVNTEDPISESGSFPLSQYMLEAGDQTGRDNSMAEVQAVRTDFDPDMEALVKEHNRIQNLLPDDPIGVLYNHVKFGLMAGGFIAGAWYAASGGIYAAASWACLGKAAALGAGMGAASGGLSYTASWLDGKHPWSWGGFFKEVGFGALLGVALGPVVRLFPVVGTVFTAQSVWKGINSFAEGNYWSGIVDLFDGFLMQKFMKVASKWCFPRGMKLWTLHGEKAVEDLKAGDLLAARSEFDPDGDIVLQPIEEVFTSYHRIWHVHVGGQVIRTTSEHPFWVRKKGWIPAGNLQIGDELLTHDGRWLPVEDLCDAGVEEEVYNFRVAEYHTYFVGGMDWGWFVWAHNQLCGTTPASNRPQSSRLYSNWFDAYLKVGQHYPGKGDGVHFREANRQLSDRMKSDPDFARALEAEHPGITNFLKPGARGGFTDKTPASVGLTWHHSAHRKGVLELVPIKHHRAPGPVQDNLHPNQQGGMEIWGGGRKRRLK